MLMGTKREGRARLARKLAVRSSLRFENLEERNLMAYDTTVLADTPIAYYRFEETSGTNIANAGSLGASANGATTGTLALDQPSFSSGLGRSINFTNGGVVIPDQAAFDFGGTGNFTIELWFNTNTTNRGDMFTYKGGGGDFGIHANGNGTPNSANIYLNQYRATVGTPINVWHHLVYTRTGTGTDQALVYVDGVQVNAHTNPDSMNIANALLIGANHGGDPTVPAIPFSGRIDEVAIYDKSLTAAQVSAHYRAAITETYVDDAWVGLANGTIVTDADAGTAAAEQGVIGVNAFSTLGAAITATTSAGTVIVNNGTYNESPTLNNDLTLRLTGATPATPSTVVISSLDSNAGTTLNLQANTLSIGDNAGDNILSGVIQGSGTLNKLGTDTLALAGVSPFSGTLAVQAGTLTGTASFAAALTVASGATVAPGGAPGILASGPAAIGSGNLAIELTNGGSDRLVVNGAATLTPTALTGSTLVGSSPVGFVPVSGLAYTILTATGGVVGKFDNPNDKVTISGNVYNIEYLANSVTLTLNEPLVAEDDTFGPVLVNTVFDSSPDSILDNDDDPDGDAVIIDYTQPNGGSVVVDEITGTFVFTPDTDFAGKAIFEYTISDGDSESTGTVTIIVSHVALVGDDLYIVGNENRSDRIVVSQSGAGILAVINNVKQTPSSPNNGGQIFVLGLGMNDTMSIASSLKAGVIMDGGEGDDYVAGGSGSDTLVGGLGNDRLIGGGGNDLIFGDQADLTDPLAALPMDSEDDGKDTLAGGNGDDTLWGQGNSDTLNGDNNNDIAYGGLGNDKVNGGAGNDRLYGGDADDLGDDGNDTLDGGAGNDLLMGQDGSDLLYGRDGNDVLVGGAFSDTLLGGKGNDLMLGDGLTSTDADDVYDMWNTEGAGEAAIDLIQAQYISDPGSAVVLDDALDFLTGETGADWFLIYDANGSLDKIKDFKLGDFKSVDGVLEA